MGDTAEVFSSTPVGYIPEYERKVDVEEDLSNASVTLTDLYVVFMLVVLSPFLLVALGISFILSALPLAIVAWYAQTLGPRVRDVYDDCALNVVLLMVGFLSIPLALLTLVYLTILFILVILLSIPWGLLTLRIFATMPSNMRLLGKLNTSVPVLKYVVTCNPIMFRLREIYVNQMTEAAFSDQTTEEEIAFAVGQGVGYITHSAHERNKVDEHMFAAYYPLPPKSKAQQAYSVVGCQFTTNFVTYTQSLHAHGCHDTKKKKELPRSHLGEFPIFVVPLYFWNPFHVYTAYVEVNIQDTPGKSIEHPMWIMAGDHKFGLYMVKSVDDYFQAYGAEIQPHLEEDHLVGDGVKHLV